MPCLYVSISLLLWDYSSSTTIIIVIVSLHGPIWKITPENELPVILLEIFQVYNKVDQISIEEVDRLAHQSNSVVISCGMKLNLDYLLEQLWEYLALICLYTKKRGGDFFSGKINKTIQLFTEKKKNHLYITPYIIMSCLIHYTKVAIIILHYSPYRCMESNMQSSVVMS